MEGATLGDYETRLTMLLSYHCQLSTMETNSQVTQLMNVTWNLFKVYSKFSQSVQNRLDSLRSPIEKELKVGNTTFYAPVLIDLGLIVFGLSICLSAKTCTLAIAFKW